MSKILDTLCLKEYNIVKYIRHKSERRPDESCERISQGTGHFPARASQGYRCLETDHQYD